MTKRTVAFVEGIVESKNKGAKSENWVEVKLH